MSQEQQEQEQQEQQEQDEYQNEIMNDEIMDKLKIDILNMHKKIKMYRRGACAPPLTPSVKGGVIGERSSPTFIPRSAVEARRKTPSVNITL